jgi:hypothetical protein
MLCESVRLLSEGCCLWVGLTIMLSMSVSDVNQVNFVGRFAIGEVASAQACAQACRFYVRRPLNASITCRA